MTKISVRWDDNTAQHETEPTTVADVVSRIAALDGLNRTLVTVYRDGAHFAVGGSAQDGLVAYCTFDNEVFWQLQGEDDSSQLSTLVAGGQIGRFQARHVVSLEAASTAIAEFMESGKLTPSLRWERS